MKNNELALSKQEYEYETDLGSVKLTPADVKHLVASGNPNALTNAEIITFLNLCKYQKLNPLLREVYLIKWSEKDRATIVVGKDVFTKRAFHNPKCIGFEAGIIVINSSKRLEKRVGTFYMPRQEQLVGGYAKVLIHGWDIPLEHTVEFNEYSTGKNLWKSKPATMIRKVALVQALREAFPDDLGGLYDASEMGENGIDQPLPENVIRVESEVEDTKKAIEEDIYISKEDAEKLWVSEDDKSLIKQAMEFYQVKGLGQIKKAELDDFKAYIKYLKTNKDKENNQVENKAEHQENEETKDEIPEAEIIGEEQDLLEEEPTEEELELKGEEPIDVNQQMVLVGICENKKEMYDLVCKKLNYKSLDRIMKKDYEKACEIAKELMK